jgi:FtsH-binding integral membrane protein
MRMLCSTCAAWPSSHAERGAERHEETNAMGYGSGYGSGGWNGGQGVVARAATGVRPDAREKFLVRTYNHLFGAIVAFALLEIGLFMSGAADRMMLLLAQSRMSWLLVLGLFIVVSWVASFAAHRAESKAAQYGALAAYVVVEAVTFVPLLWIANRYAPGAIQSAALVTLLGFAGLTGIAIWSRKDFSFLGGLLKWGGLMAIVAIVAALVFGFQLGVWFSVAMVGLAGASILYTTSSLHREFPLDRHVAASLHLFASVAMLFWYVLRIFLSLGSSRD